MPQGSSLPHIGQKRDSMGNAVGSSDYSDFVKLFVGSIPKTFGGEQMKSIFGEFGHVLEVAMIKDKRTGQQQGCCFVKYATRDEAERAIRTLNNQRILPGGAAPMQVRYADGERERLGTVEHKLFVGSLNRQATKADIEEIFSPYGRVDDVYIMRDEHKQSRGCAFVKYSSRDMAVVAINALHNVHVMHGCDQPLAVRFADPKRPKTADTRVGGITSRTPQNVNRGGGVAGRTVPWRPATSNTQPAPGQYVTVVQPGGLPAQLAYIQGSQLVHVDSNGFPQQYIYQSAVRLPESYGQQQQQYEQYVQFPQSQQNHAQPPLPPSAPNQQYLQAATSQEIQPQQLIMVHQAGSEQVVYQSASSAQPTKEQEGGWMYGGQSVAVVPVAVPVPLATFVWTEHTSPEGFKYYFNHISGESKWEKPEEAELQLQQAPPLLVTDPNGSS